MENYDTMSIPKDGAEKNPYKPGYNWFVWILFSAWSFGMPMYDTYLLQHISARLRFW